MFIHDANIEILTKIKDSGLQKFQYCLHEKIHSVSRISETSEETQCALTAWKHHKLSRNTLIIMNFMHKQFGKCDFRPAYIQSINKQQGFQEG